MACSKSDSSDTEIEIIEEEIEQIFSCVSYADLLDPQTTNQDDLMQYWTKFAADVKCTRGGPDYEESHSQLNIFFEYRSAAQIAAGVTPDHIAYSTFAGYCNDKVVNVGVLYIKDYGLCIMNLVMMFINMNTVLILQISCILPAQEVI